jgi:Bacterial Ig domain
MRRLVPGWVVTVALASAMLSPLALCAAPARADTVTVTPSTGLAPSGQSVQVSGTFSAGGPVFVVEAAHRGAQTYCNSKAYYPTTVAGSRFALSIYVQGALRHEGGVDPGDPCPDPTMPGDPPCETGPDNSCTIELRRPGAGGALASAPIAFDFPPPVCADFTAITSVNRPTEVSTTARCSDPNKRGFAIEILDGPHHGTLGPPPANGQRKYTPANRYVGPDEFTFQAVVGDQRSNVATVHIDVRGPDYGGQLSRYFREYHCGRFGRRSFDFGFRPAGGGGRRTPSFGSAKYPGPFDPLTVADPARPHLSVYYGNSWVAYADTAAFALPGNGHGCKGPAGPLVLHPHIAAPVKVTRARNVACRFKSKFSYVGLFGRQGGGAPPSVRKAVAFEIIVKHGHVKGYRTVLIATLAGAHPSLTYDRGRCAR